MSKKVLIVEDDPDIREVIAQLLSFEGYAVATAEDGQFGLDILRGGAPLPDLILLDLVIPRKDGYEFLGEQRSDPRLASIPVIVMTANQLPDLARLEGAEFLRKPVSFDELLACMTRAGRG